MKDLYIILPLIFVFLTTWLGFFVYEKNTKNPKNYFFLALMCVFILADLFELKSIMGQSLSAAKSFLFAQSLPMIFFPVILFCFNNAYVEYFKIRSDWMYWIITAPFLIVFLFLARLLNNGSIQVSVTSFENGFIIYPDFSAKAFFAVYLLTLLLAFMPFFRTYRMKAVNMEFYAEIRLLFLSIFAPVVFSFCAMVYCKRVLLGLSGNEIVYPFLLFPAAFFISTLMLGVLIVRYKSFDVSIIFNNALIYSILTISISSIYVLVQNFSENFFQQMFPSGNRVYGLFSALLVAFLFEPINSKINDFVNQLVDFFKSVNTPAEAESGSGKTWSQTDLRSLQLSYAVFAAAYLAVLVCAKLLPGIHPRIAYVISGASLSISSLYIIFQILRLPFNLMAYSIIAFIFVTVHVSFVSMTAGLNLYIEAFGSVVSTIGLISAAAMIGRIIASRIDEIAFLIPLCLVAAIADLWSVFYGVTSELITKKSVMLDYLLIKYPSLGSAQLRQFIGISDFLFAAIFMGCALNFKLNIKKTYISFILAFVTTFVIVAATGTGIPAIPILAAFFMAVNYSILKVNYEDIKTMAIVIAGSAAVFYIITSVRRILNK